MTTTEQPGGTAARGASWTAALLALAVLAAYLPALRAGFIWDDAEFVTENEALRSVEGLKTIWASPRDNPHYYPLLMTLFWLMYRLWGAQPAGYHAVTLAFHIANTLLVWLILRRLRVRAAPLAALLFGLHPVHVQSVAWVTELKNTLSGFFYLAAIWAWLWGEEERGTLPGAGRQVLPPGTRRGAGYALCVALFACALLSKTTVMSLPLAILLLDVWRAGRVRRATLALAGALVLVALAPVWVTVRLEQSRNVEGLSAAFTTGERWIVAGRSFWFYLGKLLGPADLMMIYPTWKLDPGRFVEFAPLAAVVLLLAGCWLLRRRWSAAPFLGLLFFAAAVLPIPFLDINFVLQHAFVADHFLYLPSLGVFPLLAAGLWALAARPKRSWARAALGAPALALGALTWMHAGVFRDQGALWRHNIERNPGAPAAYGNLGLHLAQQGDSLAAIEQYGKALALYPGSSKTWNNLATELRLIGRDDEALAALRKAVELNPSYFEARNNLAAMLSKRGETQESIEHLRRALEVKPDYFEGLANLGAMLATAGRHEEGLEAMRRALALRPDDAGLLNNLSRAIEESLPPDQAAARLRELAARYPDHVRLLLRLGDALRRAGETAAGEAEWAAVLQRHPARPDVLYHLGVLRQRAGEMDEALKLFEQALALAPEDAALANHLAWLLATHPDERYRDGARAAALAEAVCREQSFTDPLLLDTLAAAYAERGRFEDAQRMIRLALRQAAPGAHRESLEMRRALYDKRQPFRENAAGEAQRQAN